MSTSSPNAHSQASLLSTSQAQREDEKEQEASLDVLVSHLLASKRSLESINKVWRANEIVTAARAALEESVILQARSTFLRKGISQQVKILRKVRNELETVYMEGDKDFRAVIKNLDAANERLQKTMDGLRTTIVEPAFRPKGESPRSLLDFVDEQGVEAAQTALKESIDQTQEARSDLRETIDSFDADLKSIKVALSTSSPSNSTQTPAIPALLHSLESHAHEMANLLDSLVHHFDRCVQVIRHTEGGTLAVKTFTQAHPLPSNLRISDRDFPGPESDEAFFLSPEERAEMLAVLNNDAAEVEDVVQDIKDRSAEMESQYDLVRTHLHALTRTHTQILAAFALLETIGAQKLPLFVLASSTFTARYAEAKLAIDAQMRELHGMRDFYDGYAGSYDSLVVEVARRREAERRVKDVVRRAMADVERIRGHDREVRDAWRERVEGSLPSDLWPGVADEMPRYEVHVVGGPGAEAAGEGVAREAPELRSSVVRRARERLGE